MRKLLGLMGLLAGGWAGAQNAVPNGGITQGQVWTTAQWITAWQAKADAANGTLTSPTLTNPIFSGTYTLASPTLNSPIFTGTPVTLSSATLNSPILNSPTLSGTYTLNTPTLASPTITGTVSGGTFTGATLTSPVINSPTLAGTYTLNTPTLASPTITGTAAGGTFTGTTLTSPTINSPTLAGPTITGTATGGTFTGTTLTSPVINSPTLAGTYTLNTPTLNSPSFTGSAVSLTGANLASPNITGTIPGSVAIGSSLTVGGVPVLGGSAIPPGLSIAQLNQQYIAGSSAAANYTTAYTSDSGLVQWNGSNWVGGQTMNLGSSAVPMILPSSGTMNNNCAFVLNTALDKTYTSAFIYFNYGVVSTGSPTSAAGFYYVIMADTTHGTCYKNYYFGGQPVVPTTAQLVPWTSTGVGTYTPYTGTAANVAMAVVNVPGMGMGANGEIQYNYVMTMPNTAGNKTVANMFSISNIGTETYNSTVTPGATSVGSCRVLRNKGVTNSQSALSGNNGECGGYAAGTASVSTLSVDTTIPVPISENFALGAATDWMVLQSWSFKMTSSGVVDAPGPNLTAASATIIPPGAAALGITNNLWFLNPYLSDVSYTNSTSSKLFTGQFYNPQPATPATGGYITDVTVNGVHYLSMNELGDGKIPGIETQTQNSVAGALAYMNSNLPFYMEAAVTDTGGWDVDNFPAVWANPQEHRNSECATVGACPGPGGTNGDGSFSTFGHYPYAEIDTAEAGIFSHDASCGVHSCNEYYGMGHSLLDWPGGSSAANVTHNNYGCCFGAVTNHLIEHVYGVGWNPSNTTMYFWQDGYLVFTYNGTAFSADILNKHYYMIIGPQSHGQFVPYNMMVRYMSAWQ